MSKRTHQRWWIVVALLVLPLLSLAPVPTALPLAIVAQPTVQTTVVPRASAIYRVRLAIQTGAPVAQECSYQNASARRLEIVYDDVGMGPAPFGQISAWSCNSYAEMTETFDDGMREMQAHITTFHTYLAACQQKPRAEQHGCPWPIQ